MKRILLACVLLLYMASASWALTGTASSIGVGYTKGSFVIDTADPDSAVKKIVVFWGTTENNIARKDSLTSSITDPDTVAKAVGTFINGTTYYWYVTVEDSTTTIRIPANKREHYTITTTDFKQKLTITQGYSTAQVIHDSVGYYVAALDSLTLEYGIVSGTYTVAETLTTVTHPD